MPEVPYYEYQSINRQIFAFNVGDFVVEWKKKSIWITAISRDVLSGRRLVIGPFLLSTEQLYELTEILQKLSAQVRSIEVKQSRKKRVKLTS